MDIKKEIERMRVKYYKKRLKDIKLPRPEWLTDRDELSAIYREKKELVTEGKIYYAHVVQANMLLFDPRAVKHDCPCDLIYTTSPEADANPWILQALAHKLFSYKDKDPETVPEEWREIARVITDEYDRGQFSFTIRGQEGPMDVYFLPAMIYRSYIPRKTLYGSLLPILALPGKCSSVLVLPEKYWGKDYKKAWENKEL